MQIFDAVRKYKVKRSDSAIFSELIETSEENLKEKKIIEKINISKSSFHKTIEYFQKLGFSIVLAKTKV